MDDSWFKSVVYNSQYFRKFPNIVEYFLFVVVGNFTTQIFKIPYL